MTINEVIEVAMSFNETEQNPHFDRLAFKVRGKRIYATIHEKSNSMNLKLSVDQQRTFSEFEGGSIYPVANKFGAQGWTTFEFKKIPNELIFEALTLAHTEVFKQFKK